MSRTLSDLALKLNLAARERWQLGPGILLPPLILMTDEKRMPDPVAAIAALPKGSAVIYRHYGLADREGFGHHLRAAAQKGQILFLVAGDRSLAQSLEADGMHMPENLGFRLEGSPPFERKDGQPAFNTIAAHSHEALERAATSGVSAALLSPVFATKSHANAEPLGAAAASAWAREAGLPVYALGGISPGSAAALEESAFAGLAAIGALS